MLTCGLPAVLWPDRREQGTTAIPLVGEEFELNATFPSLAQIGNIQLSFIRSATPLLNMFPRVRLCIAPHPGMAC